MKIPLSHFGTDYQKYSGCLLYGSHASLQRGLLDEIRAQVHIISEDIFLQDPPSFLSPTLFDTPLPIIIEDVSDKHSSQYKQLWTDTPIPLILTSTSLKTNSVLVQHVLQAKNLGAVACYEGNLSDSKRILQRYMRQYDISMDAQATAFCADMTQDGTWFSAIHMLRLCPADITTEDLLRVLPEARCIQYSPLLGDLNQLYNALEALKTGSLPDLIGIIRLWQTQMIQLWPLAISLQEGLSMSESLSKITPPLFFKYKSFIEKYPSLWTPLFIKNSLCLLHQAELSVKSSFPMAALPCLLEICMHMTSVLKREKANMA